MIEPVPLTSPDGSAIGFDPSMEIDFKNSLAFLGAHAGCLLIFWCGFNWRAAAIGVALYWIRMFAITAGYHRYFSHKSYRTGRLFQFVLAFVASAAGQKGPLWWAAHHRRHHRFSDKEGDVHSPVARGFWWAHAGWILSSKYDAIDFEAVPDLAKYPELLFLDRYFVLPPALLACALFIWGGLPMLAWGFFASTVVLYHGTFSINSLAHMIGTRRFNVSDSSHNHLGLALITMGEGWHNNHHRYPASERQGMYWWEIDMTHWILVALSKFGLVWDLRHYPREVYAEAGS